jgi:hypothetical protein
MEINLEQLKKNFLTIKDIRGKVTNIFTILEGHLLNLKKTYSEFVENNRQNLFVFGLDSFQFQSKLIDIEYEDMKRLFLAINNRMYCEYYKLYKIIAEYVKESIHDKKTQDLIKITNIFPVYKDLEPYKQYKFEMIQEIHENIILLLYEINEFIMNKENELQTHKKKQEIGLNINNFVSTFNYNIIMIKEKGMLFISYIEFFHNLHTKYLKRFTMKMELMFNQVTNDIRFEDGHKINETKKQELIKNYENQNVDKTLIKKIKRSFDDSDSNSSDTQKKLSILNEESLSIKNKESMNSVPVIDDSRCLMVNTPVKDTNESINVEDNSPKNGKYKDMFKKNVKKLINGIGIFKKKTDMQLSSTSSDNSIDQMNNEQNIVVNLNPLDNNIGLKVDEGANINRTKSAEEIFEEISNQCYTLTESFISQGKKSEDVVDLLDIYDLNHKENIVEQTMIKQEFLEKSNEINRDVEEVMEDIIKKVEDVIVKNEEDKESDENMSVITMESIHNEKKEIHDVEEEIVYKKEEITEEKEEEITEEKEEITEEKEEEIVKKKKRNYKPRKKLG